MTSAARRAANRLNAAKSTGPRSAEGKAAASRNALKHGLRAQALLVFDETVEDLNDFHAALHADYAPAGAAEEEIVERIIMAAWCLRRAWRAEAATIDRAAERASVDGAGEVDLSVWPAEVAALVRYQAHHERTIQRAKAELERLRNERRREAIEAAARARARAEEAHYARAAAAAHAAPPAEFAPPVEDAPFVFDPDILRRIGGFAEHGVIAGAVGAVCCLDRGDGTAVLAPGKATASRRPFGPTLPGAARGGCRMSGRDEEAVALVEPRGDESGRSRGAKGRLDLAL
jgi:hypothetical protein